MTRQIRTWHERERAEGKPQRWDVSINDVPVPGGYIEQVGDEAFEAHYPHLAPRTYASFDEAKHSIELAPPITRDGLALGRRLTDVNDEDLMTPDEAAELLGVSRFRVNAMVANGVLAGTRRDGSTLVSRASAEARANRQVAGPVGRFAHAFICYKPEGANGPWVMAEIDTENNEQVDEAKRLLQSVVESEAAESAEVLDYRSAMARCARARREKDPHATSEPVSLHALIALREQRDVVA